MLIKCALVDDEKRAIQEVKNTLDQLSYGSSILFDMHAYTDPKQLNLSEKYDVYILDIDMPGMNGFELTNKIYEKYILQLKIRKKKKWMELHSIKTHINHSLSLFGQFIRKTGNVHV